MRNARPSLCTQTKDCGIERSSVRRSTNSCNAYRVPYIKIFTTSHINARVMETHCIHIAFILVWVLIPEHTPLWFLHVLPYYILSTMAE